MVDYIVVGLGLAGVAFCETLERHGRSFKVFDDRSQKSSRIAAGMYNPVVLKRFTLAWNAKEQLEEALPFYAALEKKLGVSLNHRLPVFRRFASVEEQNGWFEASDKPGLRDFLSPEIHPNKNPSIDAPYGYGEVLGTGRLDTQQLIPAYQEYLEKIDCLYVETFDFDKLQLGEGMVSYQSIKAKQVIFAEGFGIKRNPFFSYLPLNGTKGEYLVIKATKLQLDRAIKAGIFVIPIGENLYLVGATYKWKDKTNEPTPEARAELLQKLEAFIQCGYEVIDQTAGIRPTVVDRRPLVGRHPQHPNLYVLNGFGSRGVMIAPMAARRLYGLVENQEPLPPEMDIRRFMRKYFQEGS
ncbi:FAD-binding oxidoreductase [Flavobacteriaceae bacterium TP-CH-4]|uniref:FAD-binding oxidoreductase n=1 Tax=Pelagihabitans pacificus TaxID=2696054 RepID=A0A967AW28_9FLAO|nr:FAD-binding oxidoreductase [Pelagihabitans pacificus]NHF61476.1 FAD-binding oxidoreductase [Pelagihabitans pacificus]